MRSLIILIFTSVLVSSAYSDLLCPKPKVPSYGYIAKGYQSTYEVGSVVVYGCKSGYQLQGSSTIKCLKKGYIEYWSGNPPQCKKLSSNSCPKLSAPSNGYVKYTGISPGSRASYSCKSGYKLKGDSSRKCQSNGQWTGDKPTCSRVNCGDPGTPKNGKRSLTGSTPGSVVKYSCNSGYRLVGSSQRKCKSNGRWSGSLPSCKPVDCGKLSSPQYGRVKFSSTNLGSKAKYTCNDGFVLKGDSVRKCQSNGRWSGDAPTCQRISCGRLQAPENGFVKLTGTSVGSKASYSCRDGYVLRGDSMRKCQLNGRWSGDMPSCERVDCGDPGTPRNGKRSLTGSTPGSVVKYSCNSGYRLVGSSQRKCQSNGRWSGSLPSCKFVDCGRLEDPQYGSVRLTGTALGSKATYSCDDGFLLLGITVRECQANGQWSGEPPICRPIDCGPLPAPKNGVVDITGTVFGSIARYSCRSGFVLEGNDVRKCQSDGQWSGKAPVCIVLPVVDCGLLSDPSNGRVDFDGTTVGEVAMYSCDIGHTLVGNVKRTCQSNGRWSGDEPTCQIIDCGELPPPKNGDISIPDTTFGSQAVFECNPGFLLLGDEIRECQANGEWSGSQPTCTPVECATLVDPENGQVEVTGQTLGSVATYSCDDGFVLEGDRARECSPDGLWSGEAPICIQFDCGSLPDPDYGRVDLSDTVLGSVAVYSCDKGFKLVGEDTRICERDGWSGEAPVCKSITCGKLEDPDNGQVSFGSTTVGSSAVYACNKGFEVVGVFFRTCQIDGTWSGEAPICKDVGIDCGYLDYPDFGYVYHTGTTYGSIAYYSCYYGYELIGYGTRDCLNTGQWSGEAPQCVSIEKEIDY